jgi:predicted O-methyltransferase YrrM
MSLEHRAPDWDRYRMDVRDPHRELESLDCEIGVVGEALDALVGLRILPHADYDHDRFLAHRAAVAENFEIPWTAITPRQQRLIYAINAITRPEHMLAAGVFCGNTFISNAGAAVGPGAAYTAASLVGVEIVPAEAERAERNVRKLDPSGVARIVAADAVDVAASLDHDLHLLYLDADGDAARGKGIYLDILQACYARLVPGAVVLAHNSVNCAERLASYLTWVRDPANMRASINVILDGEGLEVSAR